MAIYLNNIETPQLHHCTSVNSLCKILESRCFRPSFCLEQSDFMEEYDSGAYAMVCFADLLKDEVSRHLKSFNADSYLVMKKSWAIRNFVNPVVYYTKESIPAATMKHWSRYILINQQNIDFEGNEKILYNSTNLMFAYMKQYEGVYFNKKMRKFSEDQRIFYLEREWRWIPPVQQGEAYYLNKDEYSNVAFLSEKQQELIDHELCLRFNYDDILEIGVPLHKLFTFCKIIRKAPRLLHIVKITGV